MTVLVCSWSYSGTTRVWQEEQEKASCSQAWEPGCGGVGVPLLQSHVRPREGRQEEVEQA